MVSKRKPYSREPKIETVRLVTGSDYSVSDVAKDPEIAPPTRSTNEFINTARIRKRLSPAKGSRNF